MGLFNYILKLMGLFNYILKLIGIFNMLKLNWNFCQFDNLKINKNIYLIDK